MTDKQEKCLWERNPEERFLQQELEVSNNRKKSQGNKVDDVADLHIHINPHSY